MLSKNKQERYNSLPSSIFVETMIFSLKDLKLSEWRSDAIYAPVLIHFCSTSGETNHQQKIFKNEVHIRHKTENAYCTHQPKTILLLEINPIALWLHHWLVAIGYRKSQAAFFNLNEIFFTKKTDFVKNIFQTIFNPTNFWKQFSMYFNVLFPMRLSPRSHPAMIWLNCLI